MSGGLIGGLIGGVIGFFVGGPTGAMYGFEIGAAAGGILFPGKLPDQFGPRLNDLKVQISTYGTSIPIVYGRARLSGNVIWCTDLVEHSNTQEQGGKGGPTQTTTTYSYTTSAAVSMCEGPIIGVRRIWADSTLIYDVSTSNNGAVLPPWLAGTTITTSTGNIGSVNFKVYLGDETQLPDPTIEAHLGVGNVPAYRGQAYIVFTDFPLDKFGNRLPTFSFEVLTAGSSQNQITYYVRPDSTDTPNTGVGEDWIYNPVTNEIWALMFPILVSGRYVTPIVRINPDTQAINGYFYPYKNLPTTSGAGFFNDIVYNKFDKSVWLNSDAQDVGSGVCKLDAGTGAVLAHQEGTLYHVANCNPNNGDMWYLDDLYFVNIGLYQLNATDATVKRHFDNLPFAVGPLCFSTDNKMYVTDYTYLSIWEVDQNTGGLTNIIAGRTFVLTNIPYWSYSGEPSVTYWIVMDLAYDALRDQLWCLAYGTRSGGTVVQYIFGFDRHGSGILSAHLVSSGTYQQIFNGIYVWGSNEEEKFYDSALDAFWLMRLSSPNTSQNGEVKALSAKDFTAVIADAAVYLANTSYSAPINHTVAGSAYFTWYDQAAPVHDDMPARLLYNRLSSGTVYLSDILTDVSTRSTQLTSGDIDVSGQTSTVVDGYVISRQTSGRSVIEQLQQAYFFDMVESDDKVKFVNRTGVSTVTIPDDDLAAFESAQHPGDDLAITREMESTLPQALNINYMAESADYQTGTQQSRRLIGATGDLRTFDLPIVLSDDKAKQIVDAAMYALWTSRTTYKFQTTNKYAKYEPTDVVTVKGKLLRLTKRTDNNGVISWEGVQEEGQTYTQTATGIVTAFTPQTIQNAVFTDLELMDINLLRDADDGAGFYYAADGYTTGWPGMALFKSSDSGASYASIGALTTGASIGRTTGTLGNFTGGNIFDYVNSITVSLIGGGTLSSAAQLAVLNGANAALIGAEIIQYLTATLNSDGTYTLSGLLRGRRGTEFAIGTHAQGERFIALSLSTTARAVMTTAEIGLARLYKGVTIGDNLANTSAQTFANSAAGLKPYAPVQLTATRDMSGNITANWIRRTRIGGEWRDFVDASLGESSELYDVEIWDSSYSTLKRTFSSLTSPTVNYSAANQVSDFGSTQSTVYFRVYQISATVGRSYKLETSA